MSSLSEALIILEENSLSGNQLSKLSIVAFAFGGGGSELSNLALFLQELLAPHTHETWEDPEYPRLTKIRVILYINTWGAMGRLQRGHDDGLGAMCQMVMSGNYGSIDPNEPRQARFENLKDLELCIRYTSRYSTEQYTFNFNRDCLGHYPCNWLVTPPATQYRQRKEGRHFRAWLLERFSRI